jgi:hypothetical protein
MLGRFDKTPKLFIRRCVPVHPKTIDGHLMSRRFLPGNACPSQTEILFQQRRWWGGRQLKLAAMTFSWNSQ